MFRRPSIRYGKTPVPETPYQRAAQVWDDRIGSARVQAKNWRLACFGALGLSTVLAGGIIWQGARGSIVPWVVQVDRLGEAQAVAPANADYQPTDPQIAFHLARFIEQVRAIPDDAIIVRQNWLRAYEFTTDKGALALNDYARNNDPFCAGGPRTGRGRCDQRDPRVAIELPRRLGRAALPRRQLGRNQPLDCDPHHHRPAPTQPRCPAQEPARAVRQCHQLVEGIAIMKMHQPYSRFARAVALLSVTALILPDFAAAQPGSASAPDRNSRGHSNSPNHCGPRAAPTSRPTQTSFAAPPSPRREPLPPDPESPCSQGSGGSGK